MSGAAATVANVDSIIREPCTSANFDAERELAQQRMGQLPGAAWNDFSLPPASDVLALLPWQCCAPILCDCAAWDCVIGARRQHAIIDMANAGISAICMTQPNSANEIPRRMSIRSISQAGEESSAPSSAGQFIYI